jgi:hypothetical protein
LFLVLSYTTTRSSQNVRGVAQVVAIVVR